jgi:hypothetical protein
VSCGEHTPPSTALNLKKNLIPTPGFFLSLVEAHLETKTKQNKKKTLYILFRSIPIFKYIHTYIHTYIHIYIYIYTAYLIRT